MWVTHQPSCSLRAASSPRWLLSASSSKADSGMQTDKKGRSDNPVLGGAGPLSLERRLAARTGSLSRPLLAHCYSLSLFGPFAHSAAGITRSAWSGLCLLVLRCWFAHRSDTPATCRLNTLEEVALLALRRLHHFSYALE